MSLHPLIHFKVELYYLQPKDLSLLEIICPVSLTWDVLGKSCCVLVQLRKPYLYLPLNWTRCPTTLKNQEACMVLQPTDRNGGELGCMVNKRYIYTAHLPTVQIPSWKQKLQLSGTQTLLGILSSDGETPCSKPFPSSSESKRKMTSSGNAPLGSREQRSSTGETQEVCRGLQEPR